MVFERGVQIMESIDLDSLPRLLPLTIGIVGHRNIADSHVERVRRQITEILNSYRSQAPSTPILLLTAMALGADQIAAEVGFGLEGVQVVAILPMPVKEYERDFEPTDSVAAFHSSLAKCLSVMEYKNFEGVGENALDAKFSPDFQISEKDRDLAYRDCGRFISQQSHILIAVWDGEITSYVAGTSDTVSHRLNSSKDRSAFITTAPLWPQESGVLLQIPAAREGVSAKESPSFGEFSGEHIKLLTKDLEPNSWNAKDRDDVIDNFEIINGLLKNRSRSTPPCSPLTERLMRVVDREATRLQLLFKRQASLLLILGVFSLFMIDLQHDLSSLYTYFLTLVFLITTVVIWFFFVRGTLKDRFYQFRSLAEGLRVQSVWISCGMQKNASDDFLRGIPDVLWIPRAMRTAHFVDYLAGTADNGDPILSVAKSWIASQIHYFGGVDGSMGAIERARKKTELFERISLSGVGLAFLCLLLDGWRFLHGLSPLPEWLTHDAQVTLHLSLAVSAAIAAYSQLMAFREIERQYEVSFHIFKQGEALLEFAGDAGNSEIEQVRSVVTQIGKEALQETGTWLALKRDRAVHPI